MTLLTTAGQNLLPVIMDGHGYTPVMMIVVTTVWILSLVALLVLWRKRPRSMLDLWLMVVLCAWLFDIALSAVLNAGRFDLGFYAGRIYGLLAATFVLAVLLLETSGLYSRLAHAKAALEDRALQLADDVQESVAARQSTEEQLRQAQKMEAIGNLTGGIAHDFNNLLGVLIGNLDLVRERVADDRDALELVDAALDAGLRGAELNRRLLAFSRRQTLQPEEVDVNAAIAGMVRLLRRSLGERVEIRLACGDGIWSVKVDPSQLETTIVNLSVNARDAMPQGGSLVIETLNTTLDVAYVDGHEELAPGDYVVVAVSDTGAGMSPEVLRRAFDPFFTTKAVGKGTGLGLSMVYGFMKQSGGHVNIYSEAGRGTTVRLYLPRLHTPRAARSAAAAESTPPAAHGELVLVVEDNPDMRRVAVRQLVELGYRVEEAESGDRALARVGDGLRPDLLFTDVIMPGSLDGIELADRLRARIPGLPVLLSSGFTERAVLSTRVQDRPVGYTLLAKPYRKAHLAQALRRAIERREEKEAPP
ncbi:hypothetical protein TSO221_33885 [Azospirillum sp. TSO22-1]|nr:hypothetical protein TSO221_33885 [Azospirillum sp. TSO22-1]